MQVRYQTAPRSDCRPLFVNKGDRGNRRRRDDTCLSPVPKPRRLNASATQHPKDFLKLQAHLPHTLLALAHIGARLIALELVARSADREALLVQQAPDLPYDDDILALVVATIATTLDGLELRELLLP